MLIRLTPGRDERAALAFTDLASALDAGLSPDQIGGQPADGDHILVGLCRRRRVALDPTDEAVLVAAWQAGRGPAALRRLAEQRVLRATAARELQRSVRYPLVLVGLAALTTFMTAGSLGLRWLEIAVVLVLVLGIGGSLTARRGLEHGGAHWLRLPIVGTWARALAELPYLEILHALYASGVPLLRAHPQAVVACPVAAVRAQLQRSDALLQQGRPLAESLAAGDGVHPETLQLLQNGEQVGNLEEALLRALTRRREVAHRLTAAITKTVGYSIYAFGLLVAVVTILSGAHAYSNLLHDLRR